MFVTYTVTVDANGSAADPSGTVSVSDANGACPTNPVSLSDGPSAGESTASCTIQEDSAEPSGETVTASYSGDSNYNAANGTTTETVDQATPTVDVSGSPNPGAVGGEVTYTATVTGNGSAPAPTGSVSVSDGAGGRCVIATLAAASPQSSRGTCQIQENAAGSYTVTASYTADTAGANYYGPATSPSYTETVGKATPVVHVTGNPATTTAGSQVVYSVYVDASGAAAYPTGSVSVSDVNGTCNVTNLSDGVDPANGHNALTGSCSIIEATPGTPPGFGVTVTATYTPATTDNNYNGNTGTFTETVNP